MILILSLLYFKYCAKLFRLSFMFRITQCGTCLGQYLPYIAGGTSGVTTFSTLDVD